METDKGYLKKEGAQIITELKFAKTVEYMSRYKKDMTYLTEEYQMHFSIPDIGDVEGRVNAFDVLRYVNKTLDSNNLFWLSYVCYRYEEFSYTTIGETFDPSTGQSKNGLVRKSSYYVDIKSIMSLLENDCGAKWSNPTKAKVKKSFMDFVEFMNSNQFVNVDKVYKDEKLFALRFNIQSATFKVINRNLYNKTFQLMNSDFRKRSIVSAFVYIQGICRIKSDSKLTKGDVARMMQQEGTNPSITFLEEIDMSRLNYRKYKSDVCFMGVSTMAEALSINRTTMSKAIRSLGDIGAISFVLLRRFSTKKSIYFITDIYSERYLFKYIRNSYASHGALEMVELVCSEGYLTCENNENNQPLRGGEEIDTTDSKFSEAESEIVKGGFYRENFVS